MVDVTVEAGANGAAAGEPPVDDGWLHDRQGRQYVRSPHRRGIIYRSGEETVAEALARDGNRDRKPGRKSKPGRKPPPPKRVELRELEEILAEGLKSPAMLCAAIGDEWAAGHFVAWGPHLARNLTRAAEHNEWLRKRLERAASGGDMMLQLVTIMGVAGSFGMYLVPPMVYWLNLPVPDKARELLNIPDRSPDAAAAPAPPPAAPPAA